MTLWKRLLRFWRSLWRRKAISRVILVPSMGDVPSNLDDVLYVVGEKPKWAVLACPCRCGERIDVNLMSSRRPSWRLSMDNGQATLHPSLWLPQERCGSHFWLERNVIRWVD